MLAMVGLSLALGTSAGGAAGPCDLVSKAAAAQLLGQPVASMAPSGPEPDEDSGGTRTVCVYQAGNRMLIITRVAFGSAAAAREATTKELVGERLGEEEGATVTEEPGLGDKAYWATTKNGVEYIIVKGAAVLGAALGGMPQPPATYQAQLRTVAVGAASKL
jgi:hypothetical protein